MKHYGLRDDQFARIETLLGRPGTVGRNSELGKAIRGRQTLTAFAACLAFINNRYGD